MPLGRARTANLEYRIHLARASCGGDSTTRQNELRQALDGARRAVELYRDALDYQSMVIMQFDVGVTYRMLGADAAAVAALESAIEMDREYGFRQDADDNSILLMRWKNGPGPAPAVEHLPSRSAALRFRWLAGDASVALETNYARVVGGQVIRSRGARTLKRNVRAGRDGWLVTYEPGNAAYDIDVWPNEIDDLQELAIDIARALLQFPDVEIGRKGDFRRVIGAHEFSAHLSADTRAVVLDHIPGSDATHRFPSDAARVVNSAFTTQVIESKAAEDYNLETAIWIGATLEQGIWYKLSAPLSLPGVPQAVLPHDLEFAYTRQVPCTAGSMELSCIEIVVHAIPDADALEAALERASQMVSLRRGRAVHYWGSTYLRIVTDPNTLMTYVRDARRYWYVSLGDSDPKSVENKSERIVATSTYRH